jgi:DNA-binding transcriptional MerR regulator
MASEPHLISIKQASTATGLTVHTLRYYERIGLLAPVGRASNGHRRYAMVDIERIRLLNRLRLTKMPLDQIRQFARLMEQGKGSIPERESILHTHRAEVVRQIDALTETLAVIDYKLDIYQKERLKP